MKISIIIPAYNEEITIRDVIIDFHKNLPDAFIYVIDNNSNDSTNQIAKKTMDEFNIKGEVLFEPRQGKSNAVRKAFSEIDSDIYLMVDADLTYPAQDAHKLIKPIVNGYDMVVGDRISNKSYKKENKRKFHGFGNWLVKKLINLLFRGNLTDIMSGYRAFNRTFVKNYPILVEGFELETDMTLHALHKRFKILEVPIEYKDRPKGSFSKLNTLKDGIRVISTIVKILRVYKPFLFFSMISIFFILGSLACGLPVILEFIKNRFITRIPLAILATGLAIFSFLSFAIGLILQAITDLHKYEYELHLLNYKSKNNNK